jgi:F0F1-type ATP synthase membrane subunit b/b'
VETVVDQLLEIDRKARQAIDEAQQYYDNTMKEIEAEKKRIVEKHIRHAEERIAGVRKIEEQALAEKRAELAAECGVLERKLDAAFEAEHEGYVNAMFRRILAGEVL